MTRLKKLAAIIRGAQFPRTALGKAPTPGHTKPSVAGVSEISQAELMQRIGAGHAHLILDVRNPEEYKKGHIPGAINIPHDQLDSRLAEIGSHMDKDVVLYCASGVRVVTAANILQSAGFSKLLHLAGDMKAWLNNGKLPVAQ